MDVVGQASLSKTRKVYDVQVSEGFQLQLPEELSTASWSRYSMPDQSPSRSPGDCALLRSTRLAATYGRDNVFLWLPMLTPVLLQAASTGCAGGFINLDGSAHLPASLVVCVVALGSPVVG